eukprot:1153521-Pelagomonas_calceolata.AAC.8
MLFARLELGLQKSLYRGAAVLGPASRQLAPFPLSSDWRGIGSAKKATLHDPVRYSVSNSLHPSMHALLATVDVDCLQLEVPKRQRCMTL